jgi:uncharacterized membrane protein YeaQ/YmgE (transglycosylase-associated protein family)
MDDALRELYGEAQRSQAQFIYFVLGAAGAAIGFAVHQTTGKPLTWIMAPIGAAVILWALSFFCGLVAIQRRQAAIFRNFNFHQTKAGALQISPHAHVILAEEFAEAEAELTKLSRKPHAWMALQRWCLFLGALAYLTGHVMQMAQAALKVPATPTATAAFQSQAAR